MQNKKGIYHFGISLIRGLIGEIIPDVYSYPISEGQTFASSVTFVYSLSEAYADSSTDTYQYLTDPISLSFIRETQIQRMSFSSFKYNANMTFSSSVSVKAYL